MSWVDSESQRLRDADESHARRQQAHATQIGGLWEGLQNQISKDLGEINCNFELVNRRLGGEQARLEFCEGGFQIVKTLYPAMWIQVMFGYDHFHIKQITAKDRFSSEVHDTSLSIHLDSNNRLYLIGTNDHGEGCPMTIAETSQSILRPLLYIAP